MKVKCLFLFLCPFYLWAQVNFSAVPQTNFEREISSKVPMAIADLNNDLLDDIITLDNGNHLKVYFQTQTTGLFYPKDYGPVSLFDQFAVAVGDMDNDGWKEIFVGGVYDGIKVFKSFNNSTDYLKFTETTVDFFTQNISLIDINNDGFLDLTVNDDDDVPKFFINIEGLAFEEIEPLDFIYSGDEGSGNYGGLWTDFDSDGDLDYYISKCRLGVDDPSDPRRINQLWQNDGNGNFEEVASDFGIANGEQTWVSEFTDLDNDGDKDLVMLNHTKGNLILENVDGEYVERQIGDSWDEVFEGIQLIVRDFDNDGLKDIAIAGFKTKMFWNKGELDFEEDSNFLNSRTALSIAIGDLNNDALWDILANYAVGLTQKNKYYTDEVWINSGQNNHFLKLSLEGHLSNAGAIGASCWLYGPWGIQSYEIRSGESYGIENSTDVIFGLGQHTSFDSLIINWPSGSQGRYYDLEIDEHNLIVEGECVQMIEPLMLPQELNLCDLDSVELVAPVADEYLWSDGSSSSSIFVDQRGFYQVQLLNESGCTYKAGSFFVQSDEDTAPPEIEILNPLRLYCPDDLLVLQTQYETALWLQDVVAGSIVVRASDTVVATVAYCPIKNSEAFRAPTLDITSPTPIENTILFGQDAVFNVMGSNIKWYETIDSDISIGQGSSFEISGLEADSTLYATSTIDTILADTLWAPIDHENFGLPPENVNGGLIFSVENYATTLASVKCFSDTSATRRIQIKDYWGTVLFEKEVLISPDDSIIALDFPLEPSPYYLLTTDAEVNMENFGTKSPQLKRSLFTNSIYKLTSEQGNVIIHETTGTPLSFYSFYDWTLEDLRVTCESEKVPVRVFVDLESGVEEHERNTIKIYPNPSDGDVKVLLSENPGSNYSVCNLQGYIVKQGDLEERLDFSQLAPGVYLFKVDDQVIKLLIL